MKFSLSLQPQSLCSPSVLGFRNLICFSACFSSSSPVAIASNAAISIINIITGLFSSRAAVRNVFLADSFTSGALFLLFVGTHLVPFHFVLL